MNLNVNRGGAWETKERQVSALDVVSQMDKTPSALNVDRTPSTHVAHVSLSLAVPVA